MTIEEMYAKIIEAGYGGVCTWQMGNKHMGCLLSKNFEKLGITNCWDWQVCLYDVYAELLRNVEI